MTSHDMTVGIVLGALVLSGGCGGRALIDGDDGTADNGGMNPGQIDGGWSADGESGGDGGAGCPTAGANATPATIQALRVALSRAWALCSPLGLTHQPQDGLVITNGDRYAVARRDAAGMLVPQRGVDFEGSITYEGSGSGHIQTNFDSDLGPSVISFPVITAHPTMLIINNEGVYEYRYVADAGP